MKRPLIEPFDRQRLSTHRPRGLDTLRRIEQELKMQQDNYGALLADYGRDFEEMKYEKKWGYLRNENKLIRDELKKLNQLITQLVESRRSSK